MYHVCFIILFYDQQMHNYLTNYHTPTCFNTLMSSSGACNQCLAKLHKYFKFEISIRTCIKAVSNILIINCITNSCICHTCVNWEGIDYKPPEDDTVVSKHVAV